MTAVTTAPTTPALRPLYLARFAFAAVWAALLLVTGGDDLGPATVALLLLYPAVDAAAGLVEARRPVPYEGGRPSRTAPYAAIAVSVLATAGLAVAAASGIPAVLRVWGAWAIVAGAIQLARAIHRGLAAGRWPMILSGGISVLAGAAFVTTAGATDPSLTGVAGYAVLGGVFFLAAALRLGRATPGR
jgi:hypothetical protein